MSTASDQKSTDMFPGKKKVEFWPKKYFSGQQHHFTTRQHKIFTGFMFCPLSCCPPRRRRLKQTASRWVIHLSNVFGFYVQPFSPRRTFPPRIFCCTSPIHLQDVMVATGSCCAFASLMAGDKTRWVLFFSNSNVGVVWFIPSHTFPHFPLPLSLKMDFTG